MAQSLSQDAPVSASAGRKKPHKSSTSGAKKRREPLRGESAGVRSAPGHSAFPPPTGGRTATGESDVPPPTGGLGTPCEITGHFFDARKEDFHRQHTAQKLLKGELNPRGKPYRIVHCTHTVKSKEAGVDVLMGTSGRAKFSGLQTCGSVWNCRPCQKKITRLREAEIQNAMDQHFDAKGTCYMITFTHGHKAHDALRPMVEGYASAMSYMTSHRSYKALIIEFCLGGRVRALETTFGWANGWHPHGHELHFRDGKRLTKARCEDLKNGLFPLWLAACEKFGLPPPSEERGVDIRIAWSAAEYLAKIGRDQKWGAGKELTRLNSKRSTNGERFTPFDLLRAYDKGYKPETMCALFREYAEAYYGRRQLHWSDGLKARFAIEEIEDSEAVELVEEEHTKAGNLEYQDWRKIIRQSRDRRVEVLEACEKGGFAAVQDLVDGMPAGLASEQPEEVKPTYQAKQKAAAATPAFWEKHARAPIPIAPHRSYTVIYLGCSEIIGNHSPP